MTESRPWTEAEDDYVRYTMDKPAEIVRRRVHRTRDAVYMRRTIIRRNGGVPCCRDCPQSRGYEHTDEMVFCLVDADAVPADREMCRDMRAALARSVKRQLKNPYHPAHYEEMRTWHER